MPVLVGQMDQGSQGWHHHSAEQTILLQDMAGRIWRAAERMSHWKKLQCSCESAWKGREMERIVAPFLGQLQGTLSRFLSHLFHPSFQDIPAAVSCLLEAQKASGIPTGIQFPPDPCNLVCHLQ